MNRYAPFVVLVALAALVAACAPQMALVGEGSAGVTGSVAVDWGKGTAAPGKEVLLLNARTGKVVETTKTNWAGQYGFGGVAPGAYLVRVGQFQQSVQVTKGDHKVNFDLSEPDGAYKWQKQLYQGLLSAITPAGSQGGQAAGSSQAAQGAPQGGQGAYAAPGPNDQALMQQFAGVFWGYAGSTETRMFFCPDGRFSESSESSYSGRGSDSLGNQTMAWGTAGQKAARGAWAITGNMSQGTMTIRWSSGTVRKVPYRAIDSQCYYFNNDKLCRTGPAQCN
jgi:hypothetical protein